MNNLILTAGLCFMITSLASSSKLICYYTNWARYRAGDGQFMLSDVDPNLCTHLIYAFAGINNANELVSTDWNDNYKSFNQLKDRNSNLKTLLAVGGWNFGTEKFITMVSTPANREKFIKSSIAVLRDGNFDGINLDWEFPGTGRNPQENKKKFTLLCQELLNAYEAEGTATARPRLLVTAAVAAHKSTIDDSYEVQEIAKYLDFINVMTFDLHGTWNGATGHHSPLYKGNTQSDIYSNIDYAMQYWLDQGAAADKLILGFPAYGRTFTLSTQSSGVGAPISGAGNAGLYTKEAGFWSYYEVCLNLEGKTIQWIEEQKVPYGTTGNQWVGFDNKASIDAKVNYVKAKNFGGVFVWSIALDDFSGKFCKQGAYPLISHLHSLLISEDTTTTTSTTTTTTTTSSPTTTTTSTTSSPTTTTTTTTSGEKIDLNFCNGKADGFYSNPNDQHSFYRCVSNFTYVLDCPPGLVFQIECICCNWP